MNTSKPLRALALLGVIWSLPVGAQPYALDQSFTSPCNEAASINDGFTYVAQTFTARLSGTLTAISVDIVGYHAFPLHIEIRGVSDGHPNSTLLGSTTLGSSSSSLAHMIFFSEVIPITTGSQYAIIANYAGAPPHDVQGVWAGASGDTDCYPGGELFFSNDAVLWESGSGAGFNFDQHFQTYVVVPEPNAFGFGALAALVVVFTMKRRSNVAV
jgi:hypothetical protein